MYDLTPPPPPPPPVAYQFPAAKRLRAFVLEQWGHAVGSPRFVCCSSGRAAAELKARGLDVIAIGPGLDLDPGARWYTHADLRRTYPQRLDATSGHLPVELLVELGRVFRHELEGLHPPDLAFPLAARLRDARPDPHLVIPAGSGETVCALALAYPAHRFIAEYDARRRETLYDPRAPLNPLVRALCAEVWFISDRGEAQRAPGDRAIAPGMPGGCQDVTEDTR